ncbi:MAG: DUF1553 domain-containing protein [bacterium]
MASLLFVLPALLLPGGDTPSEGSAADEVHWAFKAPESSASPAVVRTDWARDALDAFVLARLEQQGLEPAEPALRQTWLRRVSLGLTGLPPTPEEVGAFLEDQGDGAHGRVVDRLFESPRYGEHMASSWLDLARYADTYGYQSDVYCEVWPWRDWVIEAFNQNLAYDDFLTWQVAGDLLPEATREQRLATGFNRLHRQTNEGGSTEEEYRQEYVADRVDTLGTTFMGLTLACARCHDHKFDPIGQGEYYSLASFFASIDESGLYSHFSNAVPTPALELPTADQERDLAEAQERVRVLEKVQPTLTDSEAQWEPLAFTGLQGIWPMDEEQGTALTNDLQPAQSSEHVMVEGSGRQIQIQHPALAEGRVTSIRMTLPGTNRVINLSELEITSEGTNVAGQATLSQSSEYNGGSYPVSNLVDGNRSNFSHTAFQAEPWVEVRMDRPRAIEVISIWNRPSLESRFDGARIELFEDEASLGVLVVSITATAGAVHGTNRRIEGHAGGGLELTGDDAVTFPGVGLFRRWDAFSLALWVRLPEAYPRAILLHRSKAWHDSGSRGYQWLVEDGLFSASLIHFWPGDALRVRTKDPLPVGEWVHLAMTYDGSSRAAGMHLFVNGQTVEVDVIRDCLTRTIVGSSEGHLTLGERFRDRGFAGGGVDELAVVARVLTPDEVGRLVDRNGAVDGSLAPASQLSADQREALRSARQQRDELRDRVRQIMTMEDMDEERVVHRLDRGSYQLPREVVTRGVPAAIGPGLSSTAPHDRLTLARWLTDPEHPLTARVAVNRLWQGQFGRGLVATPEDFGTQGALPSHPDLLDALALEFIDSGWDVKALLRRMVLSATYRQSSRTTDRVREADPDGALLSRFPARRMGAETLRDSALFRAGLLVEKLGGPSVKPYQPAGLWQEKSGSAYQPDTGDGLYRRSLYTFWKRTSPPPYMMILDAAKGDVCVARRRPTNTPLQSLVLLNDPQFVEAARVLAEKVLSEGGDRSSRVVRLFRIVVNRMPREVEIAGMEQLLTDVRARYSAGSEAALALLGVGAHAPLPDLVPAEVAAWTLLTHTLMCLDEAVTVR